MYFVIYLFIYAFIYSLRPAVLIKAVERRQTWLRRYHRTSTWTYSLSCDRHWRRWTWGTDLDVWGCGCTARLHVDAHGPGRTSRRSSDDCVGSTCQIPPGRCPAAEYRLHTVSAVYVATSMYRTVTVSNITTNMPSCSAVNQSIVSK